MRNVVLGSIIPCSTAVAATTARPPSTKTAWQMHGPVHGVSSLNCSTLRPNKTHGQKSPVQPTVENKILNFGIVKHQNICQILVLAAEIREGKTGNYNWNREIYKYEPNRCPKVCNRVNIKNIQSRMSSNISCTS